MAHKEKGEKGDGIQTYLRIRPSKSPSGYFSEDDMEEGNLQFILPEQKDKDYINNSKLKHIFQFKKIIPMAATQDDVFKSVGTPVVQNALDGYNSTIFAYGQTGSGKTFTLTGGPERYADRGIIPRAISMIYNEFRTRTDMQYKAYISYLEIYLERGYDLLDPSHETKALEDLPKVSILEDEHGNFHLKNLTMHAADTEEDALNLLFMGDTNRAIAETPMNMASSRSHCIFSISIESKSVGSDKIRRSKLHMVDLAGSERVGKTNSSGAILNEARFINGSLFFLEMVIVALYEKATKGRSHVPYRNSMMTAVLRDSLGGNCKTLMIATINPEAAHTDESLSTCRFAQRVSLIKNKATVNEDVDPTQVIRRLKAEVLSLREEIAYLKGEAGEGDVLSPQELEELNAKVRGYCLESSSHATLNIGSLTLTKIKDVFAIMKNIVIENKATGGSGGISSKDSLSGAASEDLMRQIKDLKSCLLQRDNEIAILVNMVKKGKTADDVGSVSRGASRADGGDGRRSNNNSNNEEDLNYRNSNSNGGIREPTSSSRSTGEKVLPSLHQQQQQQQQQREREAAREATIVKRHLFGVPPPTERAIFDDAAASFDWFRERCSGNAAMEENRELLREKITEAKTMGERANQSRATITYLKNSIEAIRRERALQRLDGKPVSDSSSPSLGGEGDGGVGEETQEEQTYRRAIEQEKAVYKESFEKLRVLKPEIEHIRKMLEKSRVNMQNQFDQWYNNLHARDGGMIGIGGSYAHESAYSAAAAAAPKSTSGSGSGGREGGAGGDGGWDTPSVAEQKGGSHNRSNSTRTDDKLVHQHQHQYSQSQSQSQSLGSTTMDSSSFHYNNNGSNPGSSSKDESDVNEDIMAFYAAKEELLKRRTGTGN